MILTLVRILLISIVTSKHFLVEVEDGGKKGSDDSENTEKGGSDYSVLQPQSECGRYTKGIGKRRIVGGKDVERNEFPWQVRLTIPCQDCERPIQDCGGTILTRDKILTAAHCTRNWQHKEYPVKSITVWTRGEISRLFGPIIDHFSAWKPLVLMP